MSAQPHFVAVEDGRVVLRLAGPRAAIGRDPSCDLFLNDVAVSRRHALLYRTDEGCRLEAWQNRHPLVVNGRPIERHLLADGDRVLLGHTELRFVAAAAAPRYEETAALPVARVPVGAPAETTQALAPLGDWLPLAELRALLAAGLDPEALLATLGAVLERLFAPDRGLIVEFLAPDGLRTHAHFGARRDAPVSRWLLDEVRRTGEAVLVHRPAAGAAPPPSESVERLAIDALMAAPLLVQGRVWGALSLDRRAPDDAGKGGAAPHRYRTADLERLTLLAELAARLLDNAALHREVAQAHERLSARLGPLGMVAESPAMRRVAALLARVAPSDAAVLLVGESGVGKEVAARLIHELSPRAAGPFVAVNCGALPRDLVESELFGHARGAFTGAVEAHEGLFAQAHGGTLLLDEIGEMPAAAQAKLLRVLQEHRVMPIGGAERPVDVRVLAATNQEPRRALADGRLREDLYYRLNTIEVRIPPLRERPEDLEPLARRFLRQHTGQEPEFTAGARALLAAHSWPGNVRELRNALERAVLLGDGRTLRAEDFPTLHAAAGGIAGATGRSPRPDAPTGALPTGAAPPFVLPTLREVERRHLRAVLLATGGNKKRTAEILGITRDTLYKKIARYGLDEEHPDAAPPGAGEGHGASPRSP